MEECKNKESEQLYDEAEGILTVLRDNMKAWSQSPELDEDADEFDDDEEESYNEDQEIWILYNICIFLKLIPRIF